MTFYLRLEVLIEALEPTGFFVKDVGLLESALARPRTSVFGEDAYSTIELKTAALMHSIIKYQPMVDGNKRTSLLAVQIFLALNGFSLIAPHDEAFDFVLAVATDQLDLQQMATWIAKYKTVRQ
jgi:death on curing protein